MHELPSPTAPMPPTKKAWSLPASIAFIAAVIPAIFWLSFGYVDGVAFGLAGFFILIILGIHFGGKPAGMVNTASEREYKRHPLDFLCVVWGLSIPFAPFLAWSLTAIVDVDASNWRWLLGIRAFLCVVVPLVCALQMLRFLRRPHVVLMLSILLVGTSFPVIIGAPSAYDFIRGPRWQEVEIVSIRDIAFRKRGREVGVAGAFVDLADGRTLRRSNTVTIEVGAAKLHVLRGYRHIIDVASP